MSEEIKEILDNITNNIENYYVGTNGCLYQDLTKGQLLSLKKYITNLQQKVNQYENPADLTLFYMWLDGKAKDKITNLQQENEELKDTLKDREEYCRLLEDYKSRIDKAIELSQHIINRINLLSKEQRKSFGTLIYGIEADLNSINYTLKGGSDE